MRGVLPTLSRRGTRLEKQVHNLVRSDHSELRRSNALALTRGAAEQPWASSAAARCLARDSSFPLHEEWRRRRRVRTASSPRYCRRKVELTDRATTSRRRPRVVRVEHDDGGEVLPPPILFSARAAPSAIPAFRMLGKHCVHSRHSPCSMLPCSPSSASCNKGIN